MLKILERKLKLRGEVSYKCEGGSPIIENDTFTFDENHVLQVVPGEKVNIQEVVDAYKDKQGLKNMIKEFARTNDPSVFGFHDVTFGDNTGIDPDEKDVVKVVTGGDEASKKLAAYLGITQEELLKMTTDQIVEAVGKRAVELAKPKEEEKKEGE